MQAIRFLILVSLAMILGQSYAKAGLTYTHLDLAMDTAIEILNKAKPYYIKDREKRFIDRVDYILKSARIRPYKRSRRVEASMCVGGNALFVMPGRGSPYEDYSDLIMTCPMSNAMTKSQMAQGILHEVIHLMRVRDECAASAYAVEIFSRGSREKPFANSYLINADKNKKDIFTYRDSVELCKKTASQYNFTNYTARSKRGFFWWWPF